MFEKDLIVLKLKPGDKIHIWVRFRDEPYSGVFVELLSQTIFWKSDQGSQAKNLNELIKIEKIQN